MLQQINFFECMGVLFTAILAILFGFILWGFFKVRSEMKKKPTSEKGGEQKNTRKREIDDAYLQGICDAKHEIEKQGKTLDPDKVIAWLVANICDFEYYVKLFKQDFGL